MVPFSIAHLALLLILLVPYFLPTLIAVVRKKKNATAIAITNFFLGWTLIGWIVALVWALTADSPGFAPAVAVTNINYPAAPPSTGPIETVGARGESQAVFCQGCGAKLPPDARFCRACGKSLI